MYDISDSNFTSNTVENNSYYGFYIDSFYTNLFSSNTIRNNIDEYGVYIESSDDNNFSYNNISFNSDGFYVSSSEDDIFEYNNISFNEGRGLFLDDASGSTITSNTLNNNSNSHGLRLSSSSDNTVTSNTINGNKNGLSVTSSLYGNTFTSNSFDSNTDRGIELTDADNNTFVNNTAINNGEWAYYSGEGADNNTVTNLEIGSTFISFTSTDVAILSASSPEADPSGYQNIGKFINATGNSADSYLFLNISYTDSDVSKVDENTLAIFKHNGSWITDTNTFANQSGVNTTNNVVFANISTFSTFAPMVVATASPSSGGGGGGGRAYYNNNKEQETTTTPEVNTSSACASGTYCAGQCCGDNQVCYNGGCVAPESIPKKTEPSGDTSSVGTSAGIPDETRPATQPVQVPPQGSLGGLVPQATGIFGLGENVDWLILLIALALLAIGGYYLYRRR